MIELLTTLDKWHWLIIGLMLLIIEVIGAAGLLLWSGIAALTVGGLLWFLPMSWPVQCTIFIVQATVTTLLWWRWQHRRDEAEENPASDINQPLQRFIGQECELIEAIHQGRGRVHLNDTSWIVFCAQPLPSGARVIIERVDAGNLWVVPRHEEPVQ